MTEPVADLLVEAPERRLAVVVGHLQAGLHPLGVAAGVRQDRPDVVDRCLDGERLGDIGRWVRPIGGSQELLHVAGGSTAQS